MVFGIFVLAAGIGCFVARIVLAAYLMGVRPTKPQPELGLTFAFN